MKKRHLITLLTVALLIGGVVAGRYFLRSGEPVVKESDPATFPTGDGSAANQPRGPFDPASGPLEGGGLQLDLAIQKVTDRVVAGGIVFASSTTVGTSTVTKHVVRYVERGTGHVYETGVDGGGELRLSNTTIRGAREAVWSPQGTHVLIQYQDEAAENTSSFVAPIPAEDDELDVEFLPSNIFSPAFSPDGGRLVYLSTRGPEGEVVLYDTGNKTNSVVFSSPIKKWLVSWADNNTVLLQTPPSRFADGFAYLLDLGSGEVDKLIGGLSGLSIIYNPAVGSLIFSASTQNKTPATLIDSDKEMVPLGISTIVQEKCSAVSESPTIICATPTNIPAADYPDDWLLGKISFSDILWEIDTDTGLVRIVADPVEEAGENLDVTNPLISQDGNFMVFRNKEDLSLWLVNLQKVVPID